MGNTRRFVPLVLLLVLLGVLPAPPADAAIVYTAPLEDVIVQASHVVLAERIDDSWHIRPEEWLRGEWPRNEFQIHGVPGCLRANFVSTEIAGWDAPHRIAGKDVVLAQRLLLFLEACDGRLYLTGYRRFGGGFGAHASVRLFTTEGKPLRLTQTMNPGGPVPWHAEAATEKELLAIVRYLLTRHRYQPPPGDRSAMPPEHASTFYTALDDVVDWYQGGWHHDLRGWQSNVADRETTLATADRIEHWMDGVPGDVRIHGLDALMLMGRIVQGRGVTVPEVIQRARRRLDEVDAAVAEAWILREVEHGGYYANRHAYGLLARDVGPETYEKVLRVLETWVARTEVNTGTGCWWALVELGHRDRAEAAAAKRKLREAAESERR